MTTNEAASRLRVQFGRVIVTDAYGKDRVADLLDRALAEERQATVERIRMRVEQEAYSDDDPKHLHPLNSRLWYILDAERDR